MKLKSTALFISALLITSPSYALFGFGSKSDDSATDTSSLTALADSVTSQVTGSENSALLDSLTSQLGVSSTQAAGGTGALLALATSSLGSSESSELSSLIPGMSSLTGSSSLINNITDMAGVSDTFSALGLDSSMISQFAPVLIEYLTGQGASSSLISSLSSVWQ